MNNIHPYRFKTKEEFEKEYGILWRSCCRHFLFVGSMDYLFGIDIKLTEEELNQSLKTYDKTDPKSRYFTIPRLDNYNIWYISINYITKRSPNYKPKKFLKEW